MQKYIINVKRKDQTIHDCYKVRICLFLFQPTIVVVDRWGNGVGTYNSWSSFIKNIKRNGEMRIINQTVAKSLNDLTMRCCLLIALAI